ncbi:MAG TPA: erythromycin esterase family protein [Microvirga sp.]|jgi:erythromycin esterase-like protein|nr:erythromycin esterase family protein [Microvirga sp.]
MHGTGVSRRALLSQRALLSRRALLAGGLAAAASLRPGFARAQAAPQRDDADRLRLIARHAEPLPDFESEAFGALFDRLGDARVVLLGESTHGTSEFYRARAAITRRLVTRHGFTIVAAEADWPDAAHVDAYARGRRERPAAPARPFRRFPTWMWRNEEMRALVDWLKEHNAGLEPARQAGFYGLDLYSTASSMEAVIAHMERTDPQAAAEVRGHYACLAGYGGDLSDYAADLIRPRFDPCSDDVAAALRIVTERAGRPGDEAALDAVRNARVVVGSEAFTRAQVQGTDSSWNLRDRHMFDTLLAVLEARGPEARAVVWAHNSHVGNAAATEMGRRGETNIGELCRRHFGSAARLVGFGTDRGTVMAASRWGAAPEVKTVRPSLPDSHGALLRDAGPERFLLDLRDPDLRRALEPARPQRAIGVLYLPETERVSHYFDASLPDQFDAFVFVEETRAVTPIREPAASLPAGHPFA